MRVIYLLMVYAHVLAACLLIGGSLFMLFNVSVMGAHAEVRSAAPTVAPWLAARFKKIRWHSIAVLMVTGFYALWQRGLSPLALAGADAWKGAWGHTLACKLVVFAVVLGVMAYVDYVVSPALGRAMAGGDAAQAGVVRAKMNRLIKINSTLGLVLVGLGVLLVRGI
ncbi:MAG: CopD family protein [Deltaproteobacteria bacterium]|nr:CopD family protein [Deltaproteobacteria bacterium]